MLNSRNRRLPAVIALLVLSGCATTGDKRASDDAVAEPTRFTPVFALMRDKEFVRAEEALLKLGKQTPNDAQVHTNLGIVYAHMSRLEDSTSALKRAIELDPKAAVAYNELGITHRRAGRFAEAEEAYRTAIKVQPDYAKAHYNLGVLLDLYLHRREQAIVYYEQYLEIENPDDKQVQAWVKDLQRRTGQGPSTAAAGAEVERR